MTTRCSRSMAAAGAMLLLVGCASAPKVAVREPAGPNANGQLQASSTRERAPLDMNKEVFLWNNDFGQNDFLYLTGQPGRTEGVASNP